ncbi:MAG: hypothetical protein ACYC0V_11920, partial [Armatimonadota bacterium]
MAVEDISPADFVTGLRENLIVYLSTLSVMPGVVIEEDGCLMRAATGVSAAFMNPVISTGVIVDVERSVAQTDRFFEERGLPYAWYDLRDTHSECLNEHLLKKGAIFVSDMPGMCVALSSVEPE